MTISFKLIFGKVNLFKFRWKALR